MKAIKFSILCVLIAGLLIQCNNGGENTGSNNIVIIFEDLPTQSDFVFPSGTRVIENCLLSYADISGGEVYYTPQSANDTALIYCCHDYLEVVYNWNIGNLYFLLEKGDTVKIRLDSANYPILASRSANLSSAYNFLTNIEGRRTYFGVEPLALLFVTGHHFRRIEALMTSNLKDINSQGLTELKNKYKDDYIPLSDLKNQYQKYVDNFKTALSLLKEDTTIPQVYHDYYKYVLNLKNWQYYLADYGFEKDIPANTNINNFLSDSLLCYPSYRLFTSDYLTLFYNKYKNVSVIKSSGSSYCDWKQTFDLLVEESVVPMQSKNLMLKHCLNHIIDYFSAKD
ncbi:MAG: hypothetical protein LBL90_12195, partial [Prevotellaceae bacterium]|nr:hypothetical protein [Prevotellaceae bacterium]